MKQKKDIEQLLAKYYKGETSLVEEKILRSYLLAHSSENDSLIADKALACYFEVEKNARKTTRHSHFFSYAAAACVLFLIGGSLIWRDKHPPYSAYINGHYTTDKTVVSTEMKQAFSDVMITEKSPENELKDIFQVLPH